VGTFSLLQQIPYSLTGLDPSSVIEAVHVAEPTSMSETTGVDNEGTSSLLHEIRGKRKKGIERDIFLINFMIDVLNFY
jgi:hypothetical protein